jgi:4-hydroxythreonine-4-phosphate dehydrogenase
VNAAGIAFRGYPGLLAGILGVPEDSIFLLLTGGGLRILHVTLHERLADALARLTAERVEAAGRTLVDALRALGIERPRIGLFGINPHAGENGLFGDDDRSIVDPAAVRLKAAGMDVEGPLGADLFLARRDLDGYVAMYHDQGHIPVKMLAPRSAIALSVGGGIVFSSVGHGSAFDIAGRGIADPAALIAALRLVAGRQDQGNQ